MNVFPDSKSNFYGSNRLLHSIPEVSAKTPGPILGLNRWKSAFFQKKYYEQKILIFGNSLGGFQNSIFSTRGDFNDLDELVPFLFYNFFQSETIKRITREPK